MAPEVLGASVSEHLTYAQVREMFRWKDSAVIRKHVALGNLIRFKIGPRERDYRITRASAESLQAHRKALAEDADYLVRAKMATMRAKRGQHKEEREVMLDADEIIRQSKRPRDLPDPTPDTDTTYTPPQPRRATLGFRSMRGI